MGEYSDVKRGKILQLIRRISVMEGFNVVTGGNHQWIIKHVTWQRPFPVPFKHNKIKKCYVEDIAKLIIKTGVCTDGEFKEWIK